MAVHIGRGEATNQDLHCAAALFQRDLPSVTRLGDDQLVP